MTARPTGQRDAVAPSTAPSSLSDRESEAPEAAVALDDESADALAAAERAGGALAAGDSLAAGELLGDGTNPLESAAAVNSAPTAASMLQAQRRREAELDRELIAKIQAGDPRAFRTLVERHERRAFVLAVSLLRDENDARELVQEAFLRVHRSLGSFQGTSSFFTWLYRIITNLSIDHLRRPGRLVLDFEEHAERFDQSSPHDFPLLGTGGHSSPPEAVRRGEIQRCIDDALAQLPEYHRTVILLREVEGMSYEEIAESMSVSKGTVMSRLFHARQKLQRALGACYAEQIGGRVQVGELIVETDGAVETTNPSELPAGGAAIEASSLASSPKRTNKRSRGDA